MKKTVLRILAIILIAAISSPVVVHVYAEQSIYQANKIENYEDGTVSIYIPGSFFHRYAFMEADVEDLLDELRESEEDEDPDFVSLRYHVGDDDSMTIVLDQEEYDFWVSESNTLLDILKEMCSDNQMVCEFNEDYSICTIKLRSCNYELTKDNISTHLIPLVAKIMMDYYHAFNGTLEINSVVFIEDIETEKTLDSSENYEWLISIADLTGTLGVTTSWKQMKNFD